MKREILDIVLRVVARAIGVHGVKLTQEEFDANFSASVELDRMRRTWIVDDPVTITREEMDALKWDRADYPRLEPETAYRHPSGCGLAVFFFRGGGAPGVFIESDEDINIYGVKTIDDLIAFARYLTGTSA